MPDSVTIRRPDDWHVHLRDGAMLRAVLPWTAAHFARAIVMPNLVPPVTTPEAARAYRDRIRAALPPGADFTPLMTSYLTDATDPDALERGHADGTWIAAKLYPAGATTNAHHGVTDLARIRPCLERMQRIGMRLLIHGEATDPDIDIFDREAVFLERTLAPLLADFPELRVVLEHITTEDAASLVRAHAPDPGARSPALRLGATITPHHLVINRTSIFQGGIRPHLYCLPIAKRERHRLALRRAATSGEACFFLGTDTAPHPTHAKESACGCAGCFVAPTALATYARVFDEEGALDRLEAFASLNGPAFYGLPANERRVTLRRTTPAAPEPAPSHIDAGADRVAVFAGGEPLAWGVDVIPGEVPT